MFGLGWFGTILFVIGAIVTCPIWIWLLGLILDVALHILGGCFTFLEEIIRECVDCCQADPKTASTIAGVLVLGIIFALAYFFS